MKNLLLRAARSSGVSVDVDVMVRPAASKVATRPPMAAHPIIAVGSDRAVDRGERGECQFKLVRDV